MSKNISIHFRCRGRGYSLLLKTPTEQITLSMLEDRIRKKVALNESTAKLELSYKPLLVESQEMWTIMDDEDLFVYLESIDKENRRCLLHVKVITSEPLEQLSRAVEESSFGVNYNGLHSKEDETGANAVTLNESNQQAEQVMEEDDDSREEENISPDEPVDAGRDFSYTCDEYDEFPPTVEAIQFSEAWEDGMNVTVGQEFRNKKAVQDLVDRAAFENCFGFKIKWSDKVRYVLHCRQESCKWMLRAAKIKGTEAFSIRTYKKMHTCSRASQSTSSKKRKGTPRLVASILHEDYPGQMDTPVPKSIMNIVQVKLGVKISYSTAWRGKNHHVCHLRGSPEDSYKKLYCYLHMLENVNPGTITSVKLDEVGKFKYLFIALGACIEGFNCMRKVITVDATHLKNGYSGVLVFASAQDPNRHNYPIAFGVLDGENKASWTWFFELLKTVVGDSPELVFMSDRNPSLITAIATVYPSAHHAYCIWHLSQNVKSRAFNVNKDVVAWRLIQCSRQYTVAEFESAYSTFVARYPSAAKYLVETTEDRKDKWARCYFPGERYNIDTSNCVESLNSTFKTARGYYLIPMLDAIVSKISEWFNEHRKEAVAAPAEHKLVPLVENYVHDSWKAAEKLRVSELNSFELLYSVTDSDGRPFTVNLLLKRCSCKVFDIEKYPCVHALAAFMEIKSQNHDMELHVLCSRYYWVEQWQLAYCRTVYLVPDESQWNVPDHVKELEIIPLERMKKKGRKKVNRFPGAGERRPRTKNKRRPRQLPWWLVSGQDKSV